MPALTPIEQLSCELALPVRRERIKTHLANFIKQPVTDHLAFPVHDQSEFRNDVSTLDDVKRILGRKWRVTLKKRIYPLVWHLHYTTSKHVIRERPISSFNRKLCATLGYDTNVRRARADLIKLDCLKCVSERYWFGRKECLWDRRDGGTSRIISMFDPYCKTYIVNPITLDLLFNSCLALFGKLDLRSQNLIVANMEKSSEILAANQIDPALYVSKLRVSSKLNFDVRPFGAHLKGSSGYEGRKLVEALVQQVITAKHPFIKHFMGKRQKLNDYLPERAAGVFQLSCHYSASGEHLTKIGIRDCNDLCNLRAHEPKELVATPDGYEWRIMSKDKGTDKATDKATDKSFESFDEVATELLGNHYWRFDVTSSVPRVLWLLKYGEWLDQDLDIYQVILGNSFNAKVARDCFKKLVLIALFTSSSDELIRNIKPAFTQDEWKLWGESVKDILTILKERLTDLFGKINDTLVFAHESALYMNVEEVLQELKVPYIKKFDCFYTDHLVDGMNEIIKNVAKEYYKTWIEGA